MNYPLTQEQRIGELQHQQIEENVALRDRQRLVGWREARARQSKHLGEALTVNGTVDKRC